MNSLVTYEDSDSEKDDSDGGQSPCAEATSGRSAERPAQSYHFAPCPSHVTTFTGTSAFYQDLYPSDNQNKYPVPRPPSTSCHMNLEPNSRSSLSNSDKRYILDPHKCHTGSGDALRPYVPNPHKHLTGSGDAVRPYIPKRLRQDQANAAQEHPTGSEDAVRPYIPDPHKRPTGNENAVRPYIPKRLRQDQANAAQEHPTDSEDAVRPYIPDPHKRPAGNEDAVRPYIPKRLRQDQANAAQEAQSSRAEMSPEHTVTSTKSIYRMSEYLTPHLQVKYKETGIPRSVVFQMQEHTGPVNQVQWCPFKQYSYLLLSASMDATVKVWDGMDTGKCLRTISSHRTAVRDAQWSACGQKILSGGFDSFLHITDVETGKDLLNTKNDWRIGVVRFHPIDPNLFICGGFSPTMKAWDVRMNKVIHVYKAAVQQHFDILFLPGGKEFLSSTDSVSQDSADRTIIAWDFATAAKISNQIFHERYTCPSLALHPKDSVFAAQTNGNYIALFSTQRPYKMNKQKRYEGHKVEAFAVGCEFSPDGSLIVTGSSDGSVHFYNYNTSKRVRSLPADGKACISVHYHRVLTSLLAAAYWDGQIRIWQ